MTPQTSSAQRESSSKATPEPGEPGGVWALVDARAADGEIDSTTRLAGLPLVARQLRLAARQKWAGAVVRVEPDRHDTVAAAIAAKPPPPGFQIELTSADPGASDRSYVPIDARALYAPQALAEAAATHQPPEPLVVIRSRSDLREANRRLIRLIRKSIDQDGIVSYFVFRPLSRLMTRVLIDTPISPNHVSLAAMAFGIAAAVCASLGTYQWVALAGVLYWIGAVVDCVDGELARLRLQGSKVGEWLDTLADDVSTYGLMAGLGIGLTYAGADPMWQYIGVGGAVVGFVLQAKLYADLHRWGMTIDTAQYPWFFGTPAHGDHGERGVPGMLAYWVGFAFRRDAFVTMIAVALVFGAPRAAVIGLVIGLGVFLAIFITDAVVTIVRGGHDGRGAPMKWSVGYFGVKDLFTLVNLAGGIGGIYYALEGNLQWAGYSIFAGYLLGDALDGPVARLTNTSNKFGGEFDAAADHIAQAIAPAIMVYAAFTLGGHQFLGLGIMALLIATASIRQARFAVEHFDYPLTYCGLPRTVSGLIAISLPNSTIFFKNSFMGYEGMAAVLALVALLNLCPIPYMTHKGRKLQGYVKILVLMFLAVPPVMVFAAPEFVYDVLFFITFGYAMGAWIPIRPDERRDYWREYKRWSHVVATRR